MINKQQKLKIFCDDAQNFQHIFLRVCMNADLDRNFKFLEKCLNNIFNADFNLISGDEINFTLFKLINEGHKDQVEKILSTWLQSHTSMICQRIMDSQNFLET